MPLNLTSDRTKRYLKALATFMVIALLTLPLFACGSKGEVAAFVNGEEITVAALDSQVAQLRIQSPTLFDPASGMSEAQIRSALLDELVNRSLLSQEADKRNIEVTDAEIDAEMEATAAGYENQEAFEASLEEAGYTTESAREMIEWYLLAEKLLDEEVSADAVTDEEIAAYYEENNDLFATEAGKRTSHILFDETDEALAREVLGRVRGGEDFAELATEYSQDEGSAAMGGDLGWPTVAYVDEFEAAIDELEVGEISDLVKTDFGYHIITVTDERAAGTQSLDDATESIREELVMAKRDQAYADLLESLRAAAEIEILDPAILAIQTEEDAAEPGEATEPNDATDGQ